MRPRRKLLVTGASGGIGAQTAQLLAARGDDLWITWSGNAAGAEATRAACAAHGGEALASPLDLRDPAAVERLLAEVGERWGRLDGLVNNAGTCPYTGWEEISPDGWDEVLETNARGTFLAIRHAVPLLRAAAGDRAIVNVASLAGQVGAITTSVHYAASKAAVLAITRSFAKLLAPDGIRVNAVSPGPVQTAITANLTAAARASLERAVPLGRLGAPADVAHAIVLLASPEAAFTTGATYDVNGGLRMD
ncbi:MAG TPA: SDR family oxidoreductase [Conexibacter sp.]|nr:SDR family oxidoreductase [Conexibacter sp.]